MGGRLDATNVISPVISVITSISIDHAEILGDSTEQIALEKAGIIKHETPVFVYQQDNEVLDVFQKKAIEMAPFEISFYQNLSTTLKKTNKHNKLRNLTNI